MSEPKKTVKLSINDNDVEVPEGVNVIEAAETIGVDIPHYCYHSHLSVAGNCRMCTVEVEGVRGLPIACNLPVAEGMKVQTETENVKETRAAVLEFMLKNHPIDCPVCDQAGECWLQIYYMEHDRRQSVVPLDNKVDKGKAIEVGPRVMLDQERCIACTRCVRFCDEVTGTGELRIFNRTDRVNVGTYPGKPLENDYSVNTADICPVGALTQRDFRFQARVWYTRDIDSICPGCATGCNTTISVHDHPRLLEFNGNAYRLRPRINDLVNEAWMCDAGRSEYSQINDDRVTQPISSSIEVSWEGALSNVVKQLKAASEAGEVAAVASFDCTTEEISLLRRFMSRAFSTDRIALVDRRVEGKADTFLLDADKHPNRRGAMLAAGSSAVTGEDVAGFLEGKTAVIVLDADMTADAVPEAARDAFGTIPSRFALAANESGTTEMSGAVLPVVSYAEKDGTWINRQGRIQRLRAGFRKRKMEAVTSLEAIERLATALGVDLGETGCADIFNELAGELSELNGIAFEAIGAEGVLMGNTETAVTATEGGA